MQTYQLTFSRPALNLAAWLARSDLPETGQTRGLFLCLTFHPDFVILTADLEWAFFTETKKRREGEVCGTSR
jgi:hypothetical protein